MKKTTKLLILGSIFSIGAYAQPTLEVYKSPTCGCCNSWGEIMQKEGFGVNEHKTNKIIEVKASANVPLDLSSCHTAMVDGYVVEGHVPADEIKRLLKEKPKNAVGISVPGMPLESPGMEQGSVPERYDVILFNKDGSREVFATYVGSKKIK